jgi:hypothetical protein
MRRLLPAFDTFYLALTLAVHGCLLAIAAFLDAPVIDEYGHLVSGIVQWRYDALQYYCVNPPLVRTLATAPLFFEPAGNQVQPRLTDNPRHRPEFLDAPEFARKTGDDFFRLVRKARLMCIPLSLLGGFICWKWSRDLYGPWPACLAATLWCSSPMILGHGHLMTPDVGGASVGIAACYFFWRWHTHPTLQAACAAGGFLGLAQLAKFTVLLYLFALPVCWLVARFSDKSGKHRGKIGSECLHLLIILIIAIAVINIGYGFDGTFSRLDSYSFVSRLFSGQSDAEMDGNRFRSSILGGIPVPLPEWYVRGIDLQQVDFERSNVSYLNGEWRTGGWWYYYLLGLAMKETVGYLALLAIAIVFSVVNRQYFFNEIFLIIPCLAVLLVVSSKTGMNHHLRYVMPALPFAYIFASKTAIIPGLAGPRLARSGERMAWAAQSAITGFIVLLCALSVGSSLYCFPQNIAYFNELAGGPENGYLHMDNSNVEWGQDLFRIQNWVRDNGQPDGIATTRSLYPVNRLGLTEAEPPVMKPGSYEGGAQPGCYIVGVSQLLDQGGGLTYFLQCKPAGYAGFGTHVYVLTLSDANRLRAEYGYPELPSSPTGEP